MISQFQQQAEKRYPGISRHIELAIGCLYGALAFGIDYEQALGETGAAGMWLTRHLGKADPWQKYDQALSDFARLVDFASDDASFSELLAHKRIEVTDLEKCATCGRLRPLDCACAIEGGNGRD